jgi:hypothetical protein
VDVARHLPARQPSARGLRLLLLLRGGWAGAAGVLPLHAAGVLRAPVAAPVTALPRSVAIFVHFCEMFVCVRSTVTLFRMFHVMW